MKVGLGAVQFGMDYGISNMHGRTAKDELSKILQFAFKNKVDLIDTASSYGSSENVLGEVITDDNWRFVTKTPHFSDDCIRGAHVKQLKELFNQHDPHFTARSVKNRKITRYCFNLPIALL